MLLLTTICMQLISVALFVYFKFDLEVNYGSFIAVSYQDSEKEKGTSS